MNPFLKAVLLSLFLALPALTNASAFSVSYDQKVTVGKDVVATVKVVVQDNFMRAESDFSGINSVILRSSEGTFSYIPDQKMATKIPASMDRPNLTRDLAHFMEFLKNNAGKKTGAENLDGKNCDIYTFLEPTLKREAKAWVWVEKEFPVKIEVPAPEGLTLVELFNIQFDPKIAADQFKLPADVKIIDMEAAQPVTADELKKKIGNAPAETAPPQEAAKKN